MKKFLFNLYKATYIFNYKSIPDDNPNIMTRLAASMGVFLFLGITLVNISILFLLIFNLKLTISKPMTWLYMFIGSILVYLLLFKLLGLEDHKYNKKEHRPDQSIIRKTWKIFFINVAILVLLIVAKLIIRRG
jgi:hypothetical protein